MFFFFSENFFLEPRADSRSQLSRKTGRHGDSRDSSELAILQLHQFGDAHGWINEILTVPIDQAKPQQKELPWEFLVNDVICAACAWCAWCVVYCVSCAVCRVVSLSLSVCVSV